MSSYRKVHLTKSQFRRKELNQETVDLTVNASYPLHFHQNTGGVGALCIDQEIGKLIAGCPMHVQLSTTFDKYRVNKVTIKLVDQGPFDPNEFHYLLWTCIDRDGKLAQGDETFFTMKTYSSFKESTLSQDGTPSKPHIIFMNGGSGFSSTKSACSFPHLIIACIRVGKNPFGAFAYNNPLVNRDLNLQITAECTYSGIRQDMSAVMGIFSPYHLV